MFDPTVFDNLKVVLEGALYDLDLSGAVQITGRSDRVELSSMSRSFSMDAVATNGGGAVRGRIMLHASLADLSAELLPESGKPPGCTLALKFIFPIREMNTDCSLTDGIIKEIWGDAVTPIQSVRTEYRRKPPLTENHLTLRFSRKLDERQIDDIPSLLDHFLITMEKLNKQF